MFSLAAYAELLKHLRDVELHNELHKVYPGGADFKLLRFEDKLKVVAIKAELRSREYTCVNA